jgi:hypothetical protein
MSVELLLNRPNTTKYFKIGKGHVLLSELRDSPSPHFKVFLINQHKINGFVLLAFRMFREKSEEERSESFYYKEGFDREVSLVSADSRHFGEDRLDRLEQTVIPYKQEA